MKKKITKKVFKAQLIENENVFKLKDFLDIAKKQNNESLFDLIVEEMKALHKSKDHDYAGENYLSNLKACERIGLESWKGTLVRMQDKMSRLENFATSDSLLVKDESVEDTLKDLAVYSILALILYRQKSK